MRPAQGEAPARGPRAQGAAGGGKGSGPGAEHRPPEHHRFSSAPGLARAAGLDRRESTVRHPLAAESG